MRLREHLLFSAVLLTVLLPARAQDAAGPLPRVTFHDGVNYPPLARLTGIQGSVHLKITTDGHAVIDVATKDGHPLLSNIAEANVRTWKFIDHTPGNFDVTFNFHVLSNKIAFLQEPGIVDIAMLAPEANQPRLDYTLPAKWAAKLRAASGDIEAPLSLWTYGSKLQGYVQESPTRAREIRLTHADGNILGFDATLDDSVAQTLKFSLIGKRNGNNIKGIFLDYSGTSGTWVAMRTTPPAQEAVAVPPSGDDPPLITLPAVAEHRQPEYPLLPYEADIQGDVRLLVTTNSFSLVFNESRQDYDGSALVNAVTRLSGDPLLAEAAESNIRTWSLYPHHPGTFKVTFRYRLLEPRTAFLDQPGVVDVTILPGPVSIDGSYLDVPPQIWTAEFTSAQGKMHATFSFPHGSCCDGQVIDMRGTKRSIRHAHLDGDMFGFDTTLRTSNAQPLKVSLVGKVTKNRMKGVFLDYSGTAGTWTAELALRPTLR